jgi:hypothetical protein
MCTSAFKLFTPCFLTPVCAFIVTPLSIAGYVTFKRIRVACFVHALYFLTPVGAFKEIHVAQLLTNMLVNILAEPKAQLRLSILSSLNSVMNVHSYDRRATRCSDGTCSCAEYVYEVDAATYLSSSPNSDANSSAGWALGWVPLVAVAAAVGVVALRRASRAASAKQCQHHELECTGELESLPDVHREGESDPLIV